MNPRPLSCLGALVLVRCSPSGCPRAQAHLAPAPITHAEPPNATADVFPDPSYRCRSIVHEPCRIGSPQRATAVPDDAHRLSTFGNRILYNGQGTDFDAPSFRFAAVKGCAPHGDVFAWDQRDVYLLSPQSCGPNSCGESYTGYFWSPLGVRAPTSFRWLAGGYATDGRHLYNQWHHGPMKTTATPEELQVFRCGEHQTPFAHDGNRWFEDGRPLTSEQVRRRLQDTG